MKKCQVISRVIILTAIFFLISTSENLQAKSYDYYVDGSVSKSGDGSKEDPFKKISEALEKTDKSVYVKNGKYSGNLELKKGIEIFGESRGGVTILGEVIMDNKTLLENVTISGVKTAITIKKDADVEIKNCVITDFSGIGIEALAGKGKLKVTDSRIKDGSGKGFYIQKGKTIELLNNEIAENKGQEGLDIRSGVKGLIKNNIISDNGESGIEVLVNGADLTIEKNIIKNNGSSGIATQFYPEDKIKRDGEGELIITGNTIRNNKKYGLDCNKPHGGSVEKSYWRDSIELEANNISANKLKSISDQCRFIEAVDTDEEKDNSINDSEQEDGASGEPILTEEEKEQLRIAEETKRKQKEEKLKEIELILEQQKSFEVTTEGNIQALKNENKIKKFFFGANRSKIQETFSKIEEQKQQLQKIKTLMNSIETEEEEKLRFEEGLAEARGKINRQENLLTDIENSFSLFGWVGKIF